MTTFHAWKTIAKVVLCTIVHEERNVKKSVEVSTAISLNIGVSILPSKPKPAKVKEKFPEN